MLFRSSVSLPASLAQVFVPTVIDAFHRRYPDIHCHFAVSYTHLAANTRNTNTTASAKTRPAVLPAIFCWNAIPVHS